MSKSSLNNNNSHESLKKSGSGHSLSRAHGQSRSSHSLTGSHQSLSNSSNSHNFLDEPTNASVSILRELYPQYKVNDLMDLSFQEYENTYDTNFPTPITDSYGEMPPGWELRVDANGFKYFLNRDAKEITYSDPRDPVITPADPSSLKKIPDQNWEEGWIQKIEKASTSIVANISNYTPFNLRLKEYALESGLWVHLANFLPPSSMDVCALVSSGLMSSASQGKLNYVLEADYPYELFFDWRGAAEAFFQRNEISEQTVEEEFRVYHRMFKLRTTMHTKRKLSNSLTLDISIYYMGKVGPYEALADTPRDFRTKKVERIPNYSARKDRRTPLPMGPRLEHAGPHGKHGTKGEKGRAGKNPGDHGTNGSNGEDGQNGKNQASYTYLLQGTPEKISIIGPENTAIVADVSSKSIYITAIGGSGGNGGKGGKGGDGAVGQRGRSSLYGPGDDGGDGGNGGNGGQAGNGGNGGNGGHLTIISKDPKLFALVQTCVRGGIGGQPGNPGKAGFGGFGGSGGSGGTKTSASTDLEGNLESKSSRYSDGLAGRVGKTGKPGSKGSRGRDGVNGSVTWILQDSEGKEVIRSNKRFSPVVKGIKVTNELGTTYYEPNSVLTIEEVTISNKSVMDTPAGVVLHFETDKNQVEFLDSPKVTLPAIPANTKLHIPISVRFRTAKSTPPRRPEPYRQIIKMRCGLTLFDHPLHQKDTVVDLGVQYKVKLGRIVFPTVILQDKKSHIVGMAHNVADCRSVKKIRLAIEHHPDLILSTDSLSLEPIEGNSVQGFQIDLHLKKETHCGQKLNYKITLLLDEQPVDYFEGEIIRGITYTKSSKDSVLFVVDWAMTEEQHKLWTHCSKIAGVEIDWYHIQLNGCKLTDEVLNQYTHTGIYFLISSHLSFRYINFTELVTAVRKSETSDAGIIFIGPDASPEFLMLNIIEASTETIKLSTEFSEKEGMFSKTDDARNALSTAKSLLKHYNEKDPVYHYVIHRLKLDISKHNRFIHFGELTLKKIGIPIDTNLITVAADPLNLSTKSSEEDQFRMMALFVSGLAPILKYKCLSLNKIEPIEVDWKGEFHELESKKVFLLLSALYTDIKFQWYSPDLTLSRLVKLAEFLSESPHAENLVAVTTFIVERIRSSTRWNKVPIIGNLLNSPHQSVDEKTAFKKIDTALSQIKKAKNMSSSKIKKEVEIMLQLRQNKRDPQVMPKHYRPLNVTNYSFPDEIRDSHQ